MQTSSKTPSGRPFRVPCSECLFGMHVGKPWRKGFKSDLGIGVPPASQPLRDLLWGPSMDFQVSLPQGRFPGKTPEGSHSGNAVLGGACPPSVSRWDLAPQMKGRGLA